MDFIMQTMIIKQRATRPGRVVMFKPLGTPYCVAVQFTDEIARKLPYLDLYQPDKFKDQDEAIMAFAERAANWLTIGKREYPSQEDASAWFESKHSTRPDQAQGLRDIMGGAYRDEDLGGLV